LCFNHIIFCSNNKWTDNLQRNFCRFNFCLVSWLNNLDLYFSISRLESLKEKVIFLQSIEFLAMNMIMRLHVSSILEWNSHNILMAWSYLPLKFESF
jgi:hypothetical protein